MNDYTAHEIHRLDQAYPDAVNTIEDLTGDPTRKARLADVGPEVFAAELTRDLAASAGSPMSLAAWAGVATVRLMDAGRVWEEDTDKAWAKVAELTAERDRYARTAADQLRLRKEAEAELEQTAAALTEARRYAAGRDNEIGRLVAENARVRQERDVHADVVEAARVWRAQFHKPADTKFPRQGALIAAVDALAKAGAPEMEYLIWSQHHQSWWGPGRSGYRRDPADAGRYTLAAAKAEMTRGCHCCQVPEVPVFAAKVVGKGDQAMRDAIAQAADWTIKSGQANKAYEPPICRACDKPGYHPETCPTVPADDQGDPEGHANGSDPDCDDCAAAIHEAATR